MTHLAHIGRRWKTTGFMLLIATFACFGCGGGGNDAAQAEDPAVDASVGAKPGVESEGMPEMVEKAVSIARAIEREPERAAEILKVHGMTGAEFEAYLYDIAQDPDMAAAYALAMTGD